MRASNRLSGMTLGVAIVAATHASRAVAFDHEFLPLGASAKFQAGAGAVTARGAPAVLYNPANLSRDPKSEAYAELSVMSLRYTYEYPGQRSTGVTLVTPVPLLGASFRLSPQWSLGVVALVAPSGGPAQSAKGVPSRHFGEEPVLLDLAIGGGRSPSSLLGFGLAYRPWAPLALGISVSRTHVFSDLEVADHGTGHVLGHLDADVERIVPTLGFNLQLGDHVAVGAAADAEHATRIRVKAQGEDGESQSRSGRRGGRERLAAALSLGRTRTFVEGQHVRHAADRDGPFDLNPDAATPASVHDTMNAIGGTSIRTVGRDRISVAYGWFPSPLGDGVMAGSADDGQERSGVEFGKLDGVSRNVYGIGYELRRGFGRISCGLSHHRGRRTVPETSRGYGTYTLEITYAGCETGLTF
jgi:hypothetical protein